MSCASEKGLVKLKESAQERQKHRDVTNRAAIDKISSAFGTNPAPLVWHKSCYSTSLALLIYHECINKEAALFAASRTTTPPDTTPPSLPSTHDKFHASNELGSLHVLPECRWYVQDVICDNTEDESAHSRLITIWPACKHTSFWSYRLNSFRRKIPWYLLRTVHTRHIQNKRRTQKQLMLLCYGLQMSCGVQLIKVWC